MRNIVFGGLAILIVLSTTAHANTNVLSKLPPKLNIYAGGKLGYNQQFINDGHFKNNGVRGHRFSYDAPSLGLGGMAGVRYEIIPKLFVRGELEYMYRIPAKFDAGDTGYRNAEVETQLHTILINSYIDYYVIPKLSIYATLGIGAAITDARAYNIPNTRKLGYASSFAVQFGFGLGYDITDKLILDFSFRYLDVLTYSTNRAKFPLSAVELIAGIRYNF